MLSIFKKKIINIKLFAMVFLFSALFIVTTVNAAVPYTYIADSTTTNSGTITTTINTVNIAFDYDISAYGTGEIALYQTTAIGGIIEKTPSTALKALTIDSKSIVGKVLIIKISNLDSSIMNYAIKIEKDALVFRNYTPLMDFILPFASTDFASGFQSIFMNNTAANINENIFNYNAPRDISIYVPKKYITSIETIHKKDGLIMPTTTSVTTVYPKLTNIDVVTDAAVKRLKVSIIPYNGMALNERELLPSASFSGFTTGQAGLDIDTGLEYTISIMAYDVNGKLLENFSKTQKLADVTGEIVSDYVAKTSTSSDKAITLYDLMKTPATLTSMLTAYTDNLDWIKVVYPNTNDTRVISNSLGQDDATNLLAKALSDINVQYIRFLSAFTIKPNQDVELVRPSGTVGNIVLDGAGSTITGNLIIGSGDTNIYELRNITIDGNLTVNVSGNGDCILSSDVKITGAKVINKEKRCVVTDVVSMDDKSLYKIGETIKIGVKFSESVSVVGEPILMLNIGTANYNSSSSTEDEIVFDYIINENDVYSENIITRYIDLATNKADIQATEGATKITANYTGAAGRIIYSSISKSSIERDAIRPSISSIYVDTTKTPNIVWCIASELLDKSSTEATYNWLIRTKNDFGVYIDSTPQEVVLQGDNKTVMIVMPNPVPNGFLDNSGYITSENYTQGVFMKNAVTDQAGNASNDLVIKDTGSFGTAWNESIVGIDSTKKYQVIVGTGDSATAKYVMANGMLSPYRASLGVLSGTKIIGLKNGETYKVAYVTAAELVATVAQGEFANTTKITATAAISNYLRYKVSSTFVATPNVGDVVTGTSELKSGEDIIGVDLITNKYVAVYELDESNKVVSFKLIQLTASEIKSGAAIQAAKIRVEKIGIVTVGDAISVLAKAQALVDTGYTVSVSGADDVCISRDGVATAAGQGIISFTVTETEMPSNTADTEALKIEVIAINAGALEEVAKITVANIGPVTVGDIDSVLAKAKALVDGAYTVSVKAVDATCITIDGKAVVAGSGQIVFTVVKTSALKNTADTEALNINVLAINAGAVIELGKVTDEVVTTVPSGTTNDQTSIEAAMLVLANAAVDSANYTVTIETGSTYDTATNAWSGKFVVTNITTGANTKTDTGVRNITVVITPGV
ncbi:MAG: hypothetical protein ACI8WT_000736 [Clostridium sp.]|jgi:hypothetical protein